MYKYIKTYVCALIYIGFASPSPFLTFQRLIKALRVPFASGLQIFFPLSLSQLLIILSENCMRISKNICKMGLCLSLMSLSQMLDLLQFSQSLHLYQILDSFSRFRSALKSHEFRFVQIESKAHIFRIELFQSSHFYVLSDLGSLCVVLYTRQHLSVLTSLDLLLACVVEFAKAVLKFPPLCSLQIYAFGSINGDFNEK